MLRVWTWPPGGLSIRPEVARRLPSGVVSLLFTDIEGSTRLLQQLGHQYSGALTEHRRIMRDAFRRHRGVEVDTQGDSFLVAFTRASDALAAASAAQEALASGPVNVRMAIHTGEPARTDEGYAGIDLHRGARIAAAGHGGQVLLSESTRTLIDAPVRDLGQHRLRDLSAPERIYQLEIEGLRSDFPPLRTLESAGSNLPAAVTSFVGRDEQLRAIDEFFDGATDRLITLVGPGGAGKTRLALEAARRRTGRYQHGVFHVPLVAVSDPDMIPLTIAETIGLTIDTMWGPDRSRDEQLVSYLAERSLLLLLDNFEHLRDGASIVKQIDEGAPNVHVLVTSRERLGLQAERVLEVPGLTDAGERLFVERARQIDADFDIAGPAKVHVTRICSLLEFMPLGIELAAAMATLIPAAELANELEKSLDILTAAHRDVPERHRSLRAVFDGSWSLMSDPERTGFRCLSVFRGSFSRAAAGSIADIDLPLLAALVDKSLVKRADLGRFELHELLRQYAAEALLAEPGNGNAVRDRHARWYADYLHARIDRLRGADMLDARDEIRMDLGNLRSAAEWIAARWDEPACREVFGDLDAFYMTHSWSEGADMFESLAEIRAARRDGGWLRARAVQASRLAALNQSETSDAIATKTLELLSDDGSAGDAGDIGQCLLALGTNAVNQDDYEVSVRHLLDGRRAALEAKDPHLLVWVDVWLGWAELEAGDLDSAREHFDEALQAARDTGSEQLLGYAYSKMGILADELGDHKTALDYHLKSFERFERNGDVPGLGYAMSRASLSAYHLGDYTAGLRYARAGLDAFSNISHGWGIAGALCRVGYSAMGVGDLEEARQAFLAAVEKAKALGLRAMVLHGMTGLAAIAGRQGVALDAAALLIAIVDTDGLPGVFRVVAQSELERVAGTLTPEQMSSARERGRAEGVDQLSESLLTVSP
jgi:predicted ATPase/class 3 adenylate cyclase